MPKAPVWNGIDAEEQWYYTGVKEDGTTKITTALQVGSVVALGYNQRGNGGVHPECTRTESTNAALPSAFVVGLPLTAQGQVGTLDANGNAIPGMITVSRKGVNVNVLVKGDLSALAPTQDLVTVNDQFYLQGLTAAPANITSLMSAFLIRVRGRARLSVSPQTTAPFLTPVDFGFTNLG